VRNDVENVVRVEPGRIAIHYTIRSRGAADRWEKAMSHKTHMNGDGESYNSVIPTKQPNEGRGGPKEVVEGRLLTRENADQLNPCRTQSRESGPNGLGRVREAA
jgi:hypothetical protein